MSNIFTGIAIEYASSFLLYTVSAGGQVIYLDPSNIFMTTIIFVILLLLGYLDNKGSIDYTTKIKTSLNKIPINKTISVIIFFMIMLPIFVCIAHFLFPPFEITEPKDGDFVGRSCTVGGHGAIPGSEVNIYVINDLKNKYPQDTVGTTQDGSWESNKVIFGEDRSDDAEKEFIVFATITKNDITYETPHTTVNRF